MFFTKTGRVVAWLILGSAAAHIGYLLVFAWQHGPSVPNSLNFPKFQKALNLDFVLIGTSIVLGILTEISKSLAVRSDQ